MKPTVAIVGSHPITSQDFDFDRTDCDVWVFNEALNTDWCKRADGVFQIHQPVIWRSRTNRNDPHHYEWLQEQTESTIYMIDQYEDVPKSEKYPLDEIMDKFWNAEKYFTSSVAYALALAIYKGYEKIEVYGVEMETNTEYGHQRVGVAYWIGYAEGLGIEVDFHGTIFDAPLYGYDGDIRIPIEFLEERMKAFEPHLEGVKAQIEKVNGMIRGKLTEFIKSYKTELFTLDDMIMASGQNSYNYGLWAGGHMVARGFRDKSQAMIDEAGDYLIVRQEFEGSRLAAGKEMQDATVAVKQAGAYVRKKRDAMNTNDNREIREKLVKTFSESLNKYHEASYNLGKYTGIIKESQLLMAKYDELLKASGITTAQEVKAPEDETVEVLV